MADDQTTRPTQENGSSSADLSSLNGLTMALGIEPADPPDDPLLGRNLGGVMIMRRIAEGGMGRVYEGQQETPNRTVAVKVMRPGFVSHQATQRFGMELEILGRLRHPYIAQIYSAGTCDVVGCNVPFFIMEYIPDALPITRFVKDRMLGVDARLELFRKVCEAIAHGHEQGVVHRDLKPSNILVEPSGIPKIIDFGIARTVGDTTETMTALTELGQLIGTLQYMSPEQIEADPKAVDQRTDVYALGIILYELLTGVRPYELSRRQVFEAAQIVRKQKPVSPLKLNSSLSPDIVKVAGVCLQKDRQRRYADAAELASAVGSCLASTPLPNRRDDAHQKTWRRSARPSSTIYLLAFLALMGTALTAGGYALTQFFSRPQELSQDLPAPALSPFDAVHARRYQEEWAAHLGIEVTTTNTIGATLIIIPPGRFMMGDETNAHEVTLTKPFLLGESAVTQKQWREVMGNEPWKGQKYVTEHDDVAATFVSLEDARYFCEALTRVERARGKITSEQQYRLPTEAEWEFACRAGTNSKYYFGNDESVLGDYAWFGGGWQRSNGQPMSGGSTAMDFHAHPVRNKRPNAFGLYDMHGNVLCWCSDRKGPYSLRPETDPKGPESGPTQSLRGGCWYSLPSECQSSARHSGFPSVRSYHVGFRVVLTAVPADPKAPTKAKWKVLFRSDDPGIWNMDTKLASGMFAVRLGPGRVRYLRLRRADSNDYVVLPLDVDERDLATEVRSGRYIWNGKARLESKHAAGAPMATNRLLGIADTKVPTSYKSDGIQVVKGDSRGVGYEGWGFGRSPTVYSDQRYAWNGRMSEKVIFEIAVTASSLSEDEKVHLLAE
jgi:serine/threonine protein kinase